MPSWTNATAPSGRRRSLPHSRPQAPTSTSTGPLRPHEARRWFRLDHPPVARPLEPWVEHYWTVRWDLPRGRSYTSDVLTHPCVHLTLESGAGPRHGHRMPAALVHGVVTRRFSIDLTGQGRVFGVKFRPGGFAALVGQPVAHLTDHVVPAAGSVGDDVATLMRQVLAEPDDERRAAAVDRFLLDRRPGPDPRYERLLGVVAEMVADRELTSVAQVSDRTGIGARALQRLFRDYVGVGPKWVLQRFRLQDAQRLLDEGRAPDLATLAVGLGWYDQAHFSRDFAETVGVTPTAYAGRRG